MNEQTQRDAVLDPDAPIDYELTLAAQAFLARPAEARS
jgi:hypothetical protein